MYEALWLILSQSGIYKLINASYISAIFIFRLVLNRAKIECTIWNVDPLVCNTLF